MFVSTPGIDEFDHHSCLLTRQTPRLLRQFQIQVDVSLRDVAPPVGWIAIVRPARHDCRLLSSRGR